MRAVWLREFGPPSVLVAGEADEPVAGPGQVVIDVEYANVTFVETQVRAGRGPFPVKLPTIQGNGVGGLVDGRRVIAGLGGAGGGYAERVAVDSALLFAVPDGMALDHAVALLADGRTATMLLRAAAIAPGERVLVEAAAGGVGTQLVQLAKAAGATVIAAAGSPAKLELAASLGADELVDYTRAEWSAGPVDVVFDGVGGEVGRRAFSQLRTGGRMLSYGLASGSWAAIGAEEAAARGVTLVQPDRSPEALRSCTESALAAGTRTIIGQRFGLERAADAHAAIESRSTIGKTLLEIG